MSIALPTPWCCAGLLRRGPDRVSLLIKRKNLSAVEEIRSLEPAHLFFDKLQQKRDRFPVLL